MRNASKYETAHNNSHLITPSLDLNRCGATTERAVLPQTKRTEQKQTNAPNERRERERKTHRQGKYVRKQTTNMNQELKLEIYKCGSRLQQEHTHFGARHSAHFEHARSCEPSQANQLKRDASKQFRRCIAAQSIPFIYIVCLSHSVHARVFGKEDETKIGSNSEDEMNCLYFKSVY